VTFAPLAAERQSRYAVEMKIVAMRLKSPLFAILTSGWSARLESAAAQPQTVMRTLKCAALCR